MFFAYSLFFSVNGYCQFNTVLQKKDIPKAEPVLATTENKLIEEKEKDLLLELSQFNEVVKGSAKTFEPSQLAQYLFEVAKTFSSYYQEVPILTAETKTKEARLALIEATKQVLVNGLSLLGIDILERM